MFRVSCAALLAVSTLVAGVIATDRAAPTISAQTTPTQDQTTQTEREQLEGAWVEIHALAKEQPKGRGEFYAWIFQGEKVGLRHTQTLDGQPLIGSQNGGTYTLGVAANPKAIDIVLGTTKYQGIYVFEGDTLKLCLGSDTRPTAFENSDDKRVFVLRRPPRE